MNAADNLVITNLSVQNLSKDDAGYENNDFVQKGDLVRVVYSLYNNSDAPVESLGVTVILPEVFLNYINNSIRIYNDKDVTKTADFVQNTDRGLYPLGE